MKKQRKWILTAICAAFLMAACISGNVKGAQVSKKSAEAVRVHATGTVSAKVAKPAKSDFGIYNYGSSWIMFKFTCPSGATGMEIQIFKNGKNVTPSARYLNDCIEGYNYIKTEKFYITANAVYKYRYRGYDDYGNGGTWSPFRYVSVPKIKWGRTKKKYSVKIKTPKNKKLKKYVVSMSTSLYGTYKKSKVIKANKKRTTVVKKKFKNYAINYVKVYSFIKGAGLSDVPYVGDIKMVYK